MDQNFDLSRYVNPDSNDHDKCRQLMHGIGFEKHQIVVYNFQNGEIYNTYLERVTGDYHITAEGIPIIGFRSVMGTGFHMRQRIRKDGPMFFPMICQGDEIALQVTDVYATEHLYEWLRDQTGPDGALTKNFPRAKAVLESMPSQAQSYIYLRFYGIEDIYAAFHYINTFYRRLPNA